MKKTCLYQETQRFSRWWMGLLLVTPLLFLIYKALIPILKGFGDLGGNLSFSFILPSQFWLGFSVWLVVIVFISSSKLVTLIVDDEISVRHFLFVKKTIKIADIKMAQVVSYSFIGYGIIRSSKYGTVYNIKGTTGLALTLGNGKKIYIGTQRPVVLKSIVEKIMG